MTRLQAAIAATRFGMGAAPGEIDAAVRDPRGWLKSQIRNDAGLIKAEGLRSAQQALQARFEMFADLSTDPTDRMLNQKVNEQGLEFMRAELNARMEHAVGTRRSFAERWARFWANHFTVAARIQLVAGLVGPFEREAVRPNMFGSFAGLLRSTTFHQGMLLYLDAANSIGPSTPIAKKRGKGLNENLAREIMELHTLGVGSGYTQDDIIEFAKALTGWTIGELSVVRSGQGVGNDGQPMRPLIKGAASDALIGQAVFLADMHEPGVRTVLGKAFPDSGKAQAGAVLDVLARHPATAKHIATKLVRHFVSDQPPAADVNKLADVFQRTDGDLAELARAVIDLDSAWGAAQQKFKTPEELIVSVSRATGNQGPSIANARQLYTALGQEPFRAPSPAGWPDDTASWAGPDAIKKRLEWTNAISRRMARGASPIDVLDEALGEIVSERTRQTVIRAESAEQGFTLALMSPEFQRR